ncbi:MAG: DUF433 domain-containing protein [Polaribacter sp.]|nr:DUF433 domain-containing protein [Polaribacter sp.]
MSSRKILQRYITISDDILSGTPVFKNTRVPVKILFDYLQAGDNLNEFLENYPTVKKSVAKKIIELSASSIIDANETAA